jgi:hypothetical protein
MSYIIDAGSPATDRAATPVTGNSTRVQEVNPVDYSGVLTAFEVYFATDGTDLYIGSFQDGGSYSYTMRDYEYIAIVAGGSKQIFTGKNCTAQAGDKLGSYWATGTVEKDDSGSGVSSRNFLNDFTTPGTFSYSFVNNRTYSIYATGVSGIMPIKVGGSWKMSPVQMIKVNGAWRTVASRKIKIGGAWK